MPSDDIKFVLRVPVKLYGEAVEVAAVEGKSLNRWFLSRIFGEAEDGDGRDGVRVRGSVEGRKGERGVGEAVSRAHDARGPQDQSSAVDRGSKTDRGRQGTDEVKTVSTGSRSAHDVKTCLVYRCVQCIALGKKF